MLVFVQLRSIRDIGFEVSAVYSHQLGSALFDGIQLYNENFGVSYEYDENGNIISINEDGKKQITVYENNNPNRC